MINTSWSHRQSIAVLYFHKNLTTIIKTYYKSNRMSRTLINRKNIYKRKERRKEKNGNRK